MPRFAANLTLLFTEVPFLERFRDAKEAGFDAVEFLSPYEEPASTISTALKGHGLDLVLFNMPPPNFTGGARGFAALPGGEDRFRHDFRRAMRYAEVLKPAHIHVLSGVASGAKAKATFVENLRWAASEAPGQSLTIEPLNTGDNPGYFLSDYGLAAEVLDAVAAPNVGLQYDTYHAAKITGDPLGVWATHGHRATHVQIGGVGARGNPTGNAFDFPSFFARLDSEGYQGWVSGEYHPEGGTKDTLGWRV